MTNTTNSPSPSLNLSSASASPPDPNANHHHRPRPRTPSRDRRQPSVPKATHHYQSDFTSTISCTHSAPTFSSYTTHAYAGSTVLNGPFHGVQVNVTRTGPSSSLSPGTHVEVTQILGGGPAYIHHTHTEAYNWIPPSFTPWAPPGGRRHRSNTSKSSSKKKTRRAAYSHPPTTPPFTFDENPTSTFPPDVSNLSSCDVSHTSQNSASRSEEPTLAESHAIFNNTGAVHGKVHQYIIKGPITDTSSTFTTRSRTTFNNPTHIMTTHSVSYTQRDADLDEGGPVESGEWDDESIESGELEDESEYREAAEQWERGWREFERAFGRVNWSCGA